MLKILAMSLLFVLSPQTYAQPHKTQEGSGNQKPTAPASSIPAQQTNSPILQTGHQEHVDADVRVIQAPQKDAFDITTLIVNVVLCAVGVVGVGVGIFGIIYARKTLSQISIQTTRLGEHAEHFSSLATAAKDNAEAALLNARAVINAERAWLIVKIQKDSNSPPFPIENFINILTNEGRTPAVLKSIHIHYDFVGLPDNLPVPPVYKRLINMPENTFVVGQNELRIGIGMDPKKLIFMRSKGPQVENALEFLVWYGRIIYEDVFGAQGASPREPHETRWCYAWSVGDKRFVCCGPEEYNRHT